MGKQRKTMKRVKISRKTLSGLNLTTFLVLTIFSGNVVYANSPFANVPLYLSKIEQSKAKSNLMLVIDDSGSMKAPVSGSGGKDRMTVAKEVADKLVSDADNLKNFRFGISHLFLDVNGALFWPTLNAFYPGLYSPANPSTFNTLACHNDSRCADKIVLVDVADADNPSDTHVQEMRRSIASLSNMYATPSYSTLSEVYKKMPQYMQYRCQKNYVIYITDGEPYERNQPTVTSGPGRYTAGVSYLRPLVTTLEAATTDQKVGGNDLDTNSSSHSWDDPAWAPQTIKTSVIAFSLDIPAMKNLATEGGGFYLTANSANELSEAVSTIINRLVKSPNPVPATPAVSLIGDSNLNALSVRLYTSVDTWSSQLRFLQFSDVNNSEEKESGKLKYKSPAYKQEATTRSTVINTPANGIQSLDKGRFGANLNNVSFDLTSTNSNFWKDSFIPWLDSWNSVADHANGYRSRSTDLNSEDRYLGDVLGGTILAVGKLSDFTLNSGKKTKVNQYILVNSNDGMLKIYEHLSGNTTNPYQLKFNYIAGAAERENGRKIIQDIKARADKKYGDNAHPHLYFGNGDMSQLTSPRGQNVVVSTLGQGGRGAFAVNVSGNKDVDVNTKVGLSVSASAASWANSVPLWDTSAKVDTGSSASVIEKMGYTIGRAAIDLVALKRVDDITKNPIVAGADADVRMVAFVANGYETNDLTNTKPTLHVIDAIGAKMNLDGSAENSSTGVLLKSIVMDSDTVGIDVGDKKALSSPTAVDLDGDDIADLVYAGDQNGNIYRIDLRGANGIADWKASVLFKGSSTRPISIAPKVFRKDKDHIVVLFGTGSEIYETDGNMSDADSIKEENIQEMYGIVDDISDTTNRKVASTVTRSDLLKQEITQVIDSKFRETTTGNLTTGHKGWYLPLTPRERVVKDIEVYNGTVFFNTTIIKPAETPPDDVVCYLSEAQGSGWSMELRADNGAMPDSQVAYVHTVPDGLGGSKPVSGLYVKGVTLSASSIAKPIINSHTGELYAHDFNGARTISGRSGFGMKSLVTGGKLGLPGPDSLLTPKKCVSKKKDKQNAWLLIPDTESGGDQENIAYVGKEILGQCGGVDGVRRLSWRIIN